MGLIFSSRIRPLPSRHITDHQMGLYQLGLYMTFRQTDSPPVAAAKASISAAATAYRFERDRRFASHHEQTRNHGRPDPLAAFFDIESVPMLVAAPGLRAVAIFEEMQRRHPDLSAGVRSIHERRAHARRPSAIVDRRHAMFCGTQARMQEWIPRSSKGIVAWKHVG
jgi:hypothetical protein